MLSLCSFYVSTHHLPFFLFSLPLSLTLSLCNAMTAWWVSSRSERWTFLALLWYPRAVQKQAALPVKRRSLINPHLHLTVHTQGQTFSVPASLCLTPLSEFTSGHAEQSKHWAERCVCHQSTERSCHTGVSLSFTCTCELVRSTCTFRAKYSGMTQSQGLCWLLAGEIRVSGWTDNCMRKVDIVWNIIQRLLPRNKDERQINRTGYALTGHWFL